MPARIVAERQGVEAVDDQAEMRMVGRLDELPGLAEVRTWRPQASAS